MKKVTSKISFQVRWKLALGRAERFISGAQTGEGPPVKAGVLLGVGERGQHLLALPRGTDGT